MKPNGHVVEFVDDYLHGVLGEDDAAYVERHTEACRICQVALEEARRRADLLRATPTVEASEALVQKTLQRVRAAEYKRRRIRKTVFYTWSLATAASIAIIGAFHLYYLNLSASSYDVQLYGQNTLLAGTAGSLRVRLLDRDRGRALPNIPVDIELRSGASGHVFRLASFTTDASGSGSPRFRVPDAADGKYELRVRARTPGRDEVLTRTIELARSWKLMLSTDKPVYQPGQTIRMRSLALRRPDLHPVAGEDAVFTVVDPKGNVILKQHDATSAYGISSADCPLAAEILEGTYTIGCRIGDTESRVAVEVKPYVLPKFRIDVALDRPYYEPGEMVRGAVQADYFFGKPVRGGEVEIAIRTTDVDPTELTRLSVLTDDEGAAEFAYRLPDSLIGREQDSGDANVMFDVTVRDSAGQVQSRAVSRSVTVNPIRIEVIPEAGRLVPRVANIVYLFATYADGRPAQVRVAITGVDHEVSTSALGAASFELTPDTGDVGLTLRATDDQGRIGRREVTLELGRVGRDFLVRTDRAVYDGGDTLRLVALGGGVQPVFVDFIKDGQTILTETVRMTNGRGEREFDLPPELFGTIEILAYRFGDAGLPVRERRVIYVEAAGSLHLDAELDRGDYRPGERARLVLQLTDDAGRATPGAVSLAAVDEAVFSVLDQAPGMEGTFFNLEQELLQPVYAIHHWTPNLETSAFDPEDRNCFEQALFSRTARGAGKRDDLFERLLREGMITERELQVLQSSNLDELLEKASLPKALTDALRGVDSPHSLVADSYAAKVARARVAQSRGLDAAHGAWRALAIANVVIGLLVFMLLASRPRRLAILLVCGFACAALILRPSLMAARNSAKRVLALASLRGIGTAVATLEAEVGSLREEEPDETPAIRVRQWFPETLLWRPELITDDRGRVSLDVDLADSITTWRLTGSAVTADGRLGGMNSAIRVFQPFFVDLNLPVALTRGDEVAMPVVVYNYLDEPQTVELSIDRGADWFELLDEPAQRIELAPDEVRSTSFRLRALRVGQQEIEVTALGSGVGDAVRREVEVVPDGREVAQVFNGTLNQPVEPSLVVPDSAIEGSVRAVLKIYPSTFSQVLEGLDGIFQRPYGCFEQTSSTTYPNVLALDYLRRTQQSAPDVEATARQYIHLGYQRLLGFEVDGGGFDWFGRPPGNRTLTAYGLMEFEDMARVHDVDPRLIERTRDWLMAQRNADGSWSPESHKMHINPTTMSTDARLCATAYIAWAVFGGSSAKPPAGATENFLLAHPAESIADPYVLALVCNALLAMDPAGRGVRPFLEQLDSLKRTSADSKQVWWEQGRRSRTTFYGAGRSGNVETTALAALALLQGGSGSADARAALSWLIGQKDRLGTWHTTQATVLALKALLAGTGRPLGGEQERVIQFAIGSGQVHQIVIPADQNEVMQQEVLTAELKPGKNTVALSEPSGTGVGYQLDFRYHVPDGGDVATGEPLAIDLRYDRTELQVGDSVEVQATVTNHMRDAAPMVIVDLPIPAGFAASSKSFDELVARSVVARYQMTPRSVVVYLRQLATGRPLVLRYRLEATMPVRVTAQPGRVYEYYDPDRAAVSEGGELLVVDASEA